MKNYIKNAEPEELEEILKAVLERYREIYPGWDVSVLSLDKAADKNKQLDRIIALLENLKKE